jgi:glutathione-regulated potassium-efflux system ancillary protein KefC/glutathione-regulated potassium-efflux system protein KefB
MSLTAQIALFLAAAVVVVPLFRWLKLGAVLGYLAAGVVIGPWMLGLVTDVESILHFAEFGVVLLLFVIGLELQPSRLWVMRRPVFGAGGAQVALTTLALAAAVWSLGQPPIQSLVIGFALSLSSTALILQVLAERGELKAQHGRSAFGILLFQDIAVMPALALLPLAAGGNEISWRDLALGLAVLAATTLGGHFLLRPLLRIVALTRVKEAFTAAALMVVVGTALLFSVAGLSMALGAFIAGVLLADSEYRHELEADIEPFKGLLLGLFFISVGMSANIALLAEQPLFVLGLAAGYVLLKGAVMWLVARLAGQHGAAARRLAVAMAGGGEFAFVLFAIAARDSIVDPATADLLVIVVTLTMIASPLLMSLHAALEDRLAGARPAPAWDDIPPEQEPRVIIAGFGRFGQIVARVLRARRIRFTALEVNQTQADFVRRFGNKLYYGDASRSELLRAAGADRAELLVLAIDDVEASVRTAGMARKHFPQLKILARARNRQHAFRLMDLGVPVVLRETYGTSLEMAEHALVALGSSREAAAKDVRRFRDHDEATLAAQAAVKDDEEKLMATAKASAAQLERLFESDR